MDDVKQQLQRLKKENHDLEKELRGALLVTMINIASDYIAENANIEQKARLLEIRVVENVETIENLRQERSLLSTDHKALQRRFAEISEVSQLWEQLKTPADKFPFCRQSIIFATNMSHTRSPMITSIMN